MDQLPDQSVSDVTKCEHCPELVSEDMVKLASEDGMHLCTACREALTKLRIAVQNAQGGRFYTGI